MSDFLTGKVDVANIIPIPISGVVSIGNVPLPVTGTVIAGPASLLIRAEYSGSSLLIYFADALPGTLSSAASWRIRQLSYDGNGNFEELAWPNADTSFSYVWDLRSTYTYS